MGTAIPACFQLASTVMSLPKLREEMREAGLAAARRLTWEAATRQMIAVTQGVITR